ncbi:MAG: zinc ribbon domain-containing protein [Pirellulales bacterium]|nr:zinc ribbon domain-containing protein [Pirellulales bacterium]
MSQLTSNTVTAADAPPAVHAEPCDRCGAPVDALDKFCPACGAINVRLKEKVGQPVKGQAEPPPVKSEPAKFFRCSNCGAEVQTDPDYRSYVCPFCDSTYVVEYSPELTGRQRTEFAIGFAVTPEQALERFHTWIKDNSWFRPGDLSMAEIDQKLKGVYLPFWSFSMLAQSRWSASIGEYWYRTETYTTIQNGKPVTKTRRIRETEWWPLSGNHHRYYSGYLVSGSRGLPQHQADRIKPFHLAALKRYQPYMIAGWLCEEYSVDRESAEALCRAEFMQWEQNNIKNFLPGDTHRSLQVTTGFSDINEDLILLPVYLLTYRYQDEVFQFLLNGQTGKAAGDKPVSWRRISAAIIGGVALILILLLVFFLMSR